MELKAHEIDREECIEGRKFDEQVKYSNKNKTKVDDWFDRNERKDTRKKAVKYSKKGGKERHKHDDKSVQAITNKQIQNSSDGNRECQNKHKLNNKDKAKKARKGRRECNKSSKVQWGIDNDKDDRTADNDTSSVEDDTRYAINSECESIHAGQADNEDSDNELFRPCKRTSVIRKEIGRMNNDTFDICSKTGVRKNMPGQRQKQTAQDQVLVGLPHQLHQ